jgi:cytoskeletal protein RodZ
LIDEDLLDRLPPGAYAKGFIRAYAGYLGLDPRPYVDAYERNCNQPAPELSAVVRHPVRVPNATGPRAWRIAAGAAVALLVSLGILGVFSSGDAPATDEPVVSAATMQTVESSPGPNPLGAVVRVEAVDGSSWVRAVADGEVLFDGMLREGASETFRDAEEVELVIGRPGAVVVTPNGQQEQRPRSDKSYRAVFTPETTELPPSRPEPSEDPAP